LIASSARTGARLWRTAFRRRRHPLPYHGWKFDAPGSVRISQRTRGSTFKDRIKNAGYPVSKWRSAVGYLGPLPAPLIPRLDGFVADRAIRHVGEAIVPCNWLQIMGTRSSRAHEWLHGLLYEFIKEGEGVKVAIAPTTPKLVSMSSSTASSSAV